MAGKSFPCSADSKVSYQYSSGGVEEILRPTLVVSGGRSYRKLTDIEFGRRPNDRARGKEKAGRRVRGEERVGLGEEDEARSQQSRPEEDMEEVKDLCGAGRVDSHKAYTDDVYDEGEDVEEELTGIEKLRSGNYKLKLPIPSTFFKYIIGKEGATKKRIERDTECYLWLPSKGKEGDVVIEGPTKSNVSDAKRRVEIIVWTNREKERPTHFLSIPLTQPHIKEQVAEFKSTVMDSCRRERGVTLEIFQLPEKFHITLGVLRIFTPEEEEKAKKVVKEAIEAARPLLGSEPAVICVEGVGCMKDDPTAVDILFARVFLSDASDRLQAFVDAVAGYVIENAPDLMSKEFDRDSVKLHATLMNSKFPAAIAKDAAERERKRRVEGSWRRRREEEPQTRVPPRQPFDASKIFKEFGDFHFGQLPLDTLHLSKIKEYGPDGYYQCVQDYHLSLSLS